MSVPEMSLPDAIIDCSHLGRKTTGIERITEELFSDEALGGCQVVRLKASSIGGMLFQQWFGILYAAFKYPKSLIITPGFPPSILATLLLKKRLVPYIHDVFLLTREQELNQRARYYMRPSFAFAVKRLNSFFVNSLKTKQDLQQFCQSDARIIMLRPQVRNVFALPHNSERYNSVDLSKLKIVMLGTVEPRKNYSAAVAIFNALKQRLGNDIELHIVGRLGWGPDASLLQNTDGVFCRGYLSADEIKTLLDSATFYLSTSHDEGLGLPLLELQYSGIAVVAAKIPVFAEVLGESGLLVDVSDAEQAAAQIITFCSDTAQIQQQSELARQNIQRWNALAAADKQAASVLFRE